MSPAQEQFRIVLDLHQFGLDLRAQRFRRDNPDASEATIDALMGAWMRSKPLGVAGPLVERA
jgi:hypothetical protein